ncbi:hypothetical protein QO274_000072 [Listeria monocytogenes]|nr:hypothetical protein [Listeria monocytogenes]
MSDYRDSTSISPEKVDYIESDVPEQIQNYSKQVRQKIFGKDVRESIARAVDIAGLISQESKNESNKIKEMQNVLEDRFESVQNDITSDTEVTDARFDQNGKKFNTLKSRLDSDSLLAQSKSEIFTNINDSLNMNNQDIAFFDSVIVNEKITVCFLNVSSTETSERFHLTEIKKISKNPTVGALVIARLGDGERFEIEENGTVI